MNLKSIFKKRNYKYLWYLLKPYPNSVKRRDSFLSISTIDKLINALEVARFEKIVVVASGPTAKQMIKCENNLYISTNNAILLTKDVPFIYIVNDSYYLMRYLKTFIGPKKWLGTIFWYFSTPSMLRNKSHLKLIQYLETKRRNKEEILITNSDDSVAQSDLHREINGYLKKTIDFDFYGVNSGFVAVVIGFVLSHYSSKPMEIYGLDMGLKGGGYFNSGQELGKSINSDSSKSVVSDFLNKIYYLNGYSVSNFSYFETK